MSRVTVKGIPELKAALARKAAELQAAAMASVAAEVELVGNDVESAVPVDTGDLKSSVQRESVGTHGSVKATSRHASFVEFGTYKDPEQPYMKPAADASRSRFARQAAATIGKAVGGK